MGDNPKVCNGKITVSEKMVESILLPPAFIALGMAVCLILMILNRGRKIAKYLLALVLVVYYLLSTWPSANILISSLEKRNNIDLLIDLKRVDAVVVLAGSASEAGGIRPRTELDRASWRRLWHGAEIYNQLVEKIPIIYSGGYPSEADLVRILASQWGISESQFWVEISSKNTYESGVEVQKLLDMRLLTESPHRVVLVTSAWHMPRALLVFRKLGIDSIPEPCDYFSTLNSGVVWFLVPNYEAFYASSVVIREWIAMGVYWLLGRI